MKSELRHSVVQSSKPAWTAQQVLDQVRIHSNTLSQKKKKKDLDTVDMDSKREAGCHTVWGLRISVESAERRQVFSKSFSKQISP